MVATQADDSLEMCHNFDLTKPTSWRSALKTSQSPRKVLGSISGPVPSISSVLKRTGYWCGRSGVRFSRIGTVSPTARHSCTISMFPERYVAEMGKMKLFFF